MKLAEIPLIGASSPCGGVWATNPHTPGLLIGPTMPTGGVPSGTDDIRKKTGRFGNLGRS